MIIPNGNSSGGLGSSTLGPSIGGNRLGGAEIIKSLYLYIAFHSFFWFLHDGNVNI